MSNTFPEANKSDKNQININSDHRLCFLNLTSSKVYIVVGFAFFFLI